MPGSESVVRGKAFHFAAQRVKSGDLGIDEVVSDLLFFCYQSSIACSLVKARRLAAWAVNAAMNKKSKGELR